MLYVELVFDKSKNPFAIPVMLKKKVDKPQYGSVSQVGAPHLINEIMYIDTGSSLTSVTERIAEELGIDLNRLTSDEVGGIWGFTTIRITNDIVIIVNASDSQYKEIELEKIATNPDNLSKK